MESVINQAHELNELDQESSIVQAGQNDSNIILPANFTLEPKDPKHADLRGQPCQPYLEAYVEVSDNCGELLGDPDLIREVEEVIDKSSEYLSIEDKDEMFQVADNMTHLVNRLNTIINNKESVVNGIFTENRINLGKVFNLQKEIVVKSKGHGFWQQYCKENYGESLGTIENYRRLARVPNSIGWSVLGITRLKRIVEVLDEKAIKRSKNSNIDPVGDFLKKHQINYDPTKKYLSKDIKLEIDSASLVERFQKKDIAVRRDVAEMYLRAKGKVKPEDIRHVEISAGRGEDANTVIEYLSRTPLNLSTRNSNGNQLAKYKLCVKKFIDESRKAIDEEREECIAYFKSEILLIKELLQELENPGLDDDDDEDQLDQFNEYSDEDD